MLAINIANFFDKNPLDSWDVILKIVNFSNISLVVAYIAIILSWVGYHKLAERTPYRLKFKQNLFRLNLWAKARFALDILIVIIYTALIYSIGNFTFFLGIFFVMFLLYFLGGTVRNKEYGKNKAETWRFGSGLFTVLCFINLIVWVCWEKVLFSLPFFNQIPMAWIAWVLLFITLFYLILYRWKPQRIFQAKN